MAPLFANYWLGFAKQHVAGGTGSAYGPKSLIEISPALPT